MGASSQRKILSDADAAAAVPVYGRRRSGLGAVGATRATIRDAEFRHTPGHDQSSDTGTQPTRSGMAQARSDIEANPLRKVPLTGMSDPQKRRARQLAFMLMMHTKDRVLQMITKVSDPANGFEILLGNRRFLDPRIVQ